MVGQLIQEIRYRLDVSSLLGRTVSLGLWYIWYLNDDTDWTGGMAVSGRCSHSRSFPAVCSGQQHSVSELPTRVNRQVGTSRAKPPTTLLQFRTSIAQNIQTLQKGTPYTYSDCRQVAIRPGPVGSALAPFLALDRLPELPTPNPNLYIPRDDLLSYLHPSPRTVNSILWRPLLRPRLLSNCWFPFRRSMFYCSHSTGQSS